MSLLGVYVIIGYYTSAVKSPKYQNKITSQKMDVSFIKQKIIELENYKSDALHWNIEQLKNIKEIAELSFESYKKFSKKLEVQFHSFETLEERITEIYSDTEKFITKSRNLAHQAQLRESKTIQPKEHIKGEKGVLMIENYLGGYYYFTCDEVTLNADTVKIIESKNGKNTFPKLNDVKDALLKMVIYTNIKEVIMENKHFSVKPVLKLTTFSNDKQLPKYSKSLKQEALQNEFELIYENLR